MNDEMVSDDNELYPLVEAMNGADPASGESQCGDWRVSIVDGEMRITGPVARISARDAEEVGAIFRWGEGHESALADRRGASQPHSKP